MSKLGKFAAACAAVLCAFGARAEVAKYYEYVETNNEKTKGVYVLLDYTPKSDSVVEASVEILDIVNTGTLFCSRGSSISEETFTLFSVGTSGLRWDYNRTDAIYWKIGANEKHDIRATNKGLFADGDTTAKIAATPAATPYTAGNKMTLFGGYTAAKGTTPKPTENFAKMRLYSFKAYDLEDGELVLKLDLRPCVDTDGNAALYDAVNERLYYAEAGTSGKTMTVGGAALDETLQIAGNPMNVGEVSPAYGQHAGYSAGESYPLSAPAVWTNAEETVAATCIGYKVYTNDVIYVEGSGNSFTYEHPDCEMGAKLVWQWALEYKVTASAETGGTVDPTEQWVAEGEQATVTATCDDTHDFRKWDVEPNGASYANPLSIVVTAPAVATARFQNQSGVERTWKGGATGDWDVPANWEPEGVPESGDDVVIATKNAAVSATGRLVVKSITLTDATLNIGSSADRTPFTAEIAGNLTLNGASKLYVFAGTFSDRECFASQDTAAAAIWANASVVEIGGTFAVNGTSVVYPDNDPITGTPVIFKPKDFSLAAGASFDSNQRGWTWTSYTGTAPVNSITEGSLYTYAFSPARSYTVGSGYGGKGSVVSGVNGKTYGFAYAPFLSGSPSGCYNNWKRGSGSICVFASGAMTIAGKMSTCGITTWFSGSTGGGIWLAAATMAVAQTASLKAEGGESKTYNSAGGGGRISIALGLTAGQLAALATGAEPEGLSYGEISGISLTVKGGSYSNASGYAGTGTATLVVDRAVSHPVVVTATPSEYEKGSVSPDYGFYAFRAGSEPTCTAPQGAYPPIYQNLRRFVNKGHETTESDALTTLSWTWGDEQCLVRLAPCGKGKITANGTDYAVEGEIWIASGTELTLTASPTDDGEFVRWVGDMPGMTTNEATFTVTVDKAMTFDALFTGVEPVTKTYVGADGGFWQDPANWSPAAVPTLVDDVVLDGKTVYCNGLAFARSLSQTGGALVIGGAGADVTAEATRTDAYVPWTGLYLTGDFTLSGGSFALGARRTPYTSFGAVIGGNFAASGAAKAAFYAPESADADFATLYVSAMKVSVGGNLTLVDTAVVYPEADGLTGTPVKFEVAGDVSVAEKASFNANSRGWRWYAYDSAHPDTRPQVHRDSTAFTLAPGYGTSYTVGGAYGLSGTSDAKERRPYGYCYAPFLSGSPSGAYNTSGLSGGQVWIEAAGTIALDGTLSANASAGSGTRGSASGGGIWVVAAKLVAGAKAQMTAKGGDGSGNGSFSGGTGGRISVAVGVAADDLAALARGEEPENLTYSDEITSCGANVAGGYNNTDGNKVAHYAPGGTVTTVLGEVDEFNLVQVSAPVAVIAEGLVYETTIVRKGEVWTQTVGATGRDPSSPDSVRWTCESWVISNATEEVASGEGATATFTVGKGPFTVIWHWTNRETLAKVVPNDTELGGVSVNGGEATPTADAWTAATGSVTLTAVANDGSEFICWYGDVPFESATNPTLTLDTAVPFGLKPVFRQVAEPTNYVWQVADGRTGNWEDAANWMPTNVPGPADTVTIASGTCVASNYAACAALNLSGKGALKVGAAASTLLKEAVLVVSGDVTLTNSAALTVNNPNGSYRRHMRMTVGGDLTLADKATLQLGAGPTNGVDVTLATGAGWVTVGGAMKLDGTAKVTAKGDPWTGGTVVFRVGELAVMSNATLSAVGGGYQMVNGLVPICRAPGIGIAHHVGGGYGGRGRDQNASNGLTYGFALAPIHGGSCMGDYRMGNDYRGGGLIRVHAAGRMTLNGLFDADCNNRTGNNSSGGGVWLTAGNRIRVGETAVFRARGGTGATSGVGGGGRISVCQFISPERADRMALDGEYHGVGKAAKHVFGRDEFRAAFNLPETAVNLSDGKNTEAEPYGGSFTYIDGTPSGLMLIAR